MRPEFKEQLLASLDSAVQVVEVKDYPEMMDRFCTILQNFLDYANRMRTREQLISSLEEFEDLTAEQEMYVIGLVQNIPGIMGMLLTHELPKLAQELPPLRTGRKQALTLEQRVQVCDFIAGLHRGGLPTQKCKKRAAQKFGVSLRSVERAWMNRGQLNLQNPDIPVAELVTWMNKQN